MWMVMSSLIAFIGFADLGIGNGVLTLVASSSGKDDFDAIRKIVSGGFFALGLITAALLTMFALVYPFFDWSKLFNVNSDLARSEAGLAFVIFFGAIAAAIPLGVVQKLQTGLQQGFVVSLWQSLSSLLGLAGLLIVIHFQGGLPWLVFAMTTAPLLAGLLNSVSFFWFARPDLRPRLAFVDRDTMVRVVRSGSFFLILQVAGALTFASDSIIITQAMGADAVAAYAVPEKMFSLVSVLLSMVTVPLWPAYGEAIARGDHLWVRRTLARSVAFAGLAAAAMSCILVFFGPPLLTLWVGRVIDPPFALLLGFGVWKVIEACGNSLAILLNGANIIAAQTVFAILMALAGVFLKSLSVREFGASGVIWATSLVYVVFIVPAVPYFLRLVQIKLRPQQDLVHVQIASATTKLPS
jgi:O-antigen/teichoic acid export membrane protein